MNRGAANAYRKDLFTADLSGDQAQPGVIVPIQGDVYAPDARAWALDSSELLFGVETGTDSYELFSVGANDWTVATQVADGWRANWVSTSVALLYSTQGTGYSRRGKNGFPAPQILPFTADLSAANASSERAGFFSQVSPCTGQAYFVDFKQGKSTPFETFTSYAFSPSVDLIAIGRSSPTRVDVHTLPDYDADTPLVSLDVNSGACNVGWSDDSQWLTFVDSNSKPHATHLVIDKPVDYTVSGVTMEGTNPAQVSADDGWLGILPRNLFVSAVGKDGPGPATQVNGKLPNEATDFIDRFEFAPNSASLYFYGEQEVSGVQGIYWVDLSGAAPAPYKKLYLPTLGNIQAAAWTADSVTVGYRVAESPSFPSSSPVNLYVSSVLESTPKAHRINRELSCAPDGSSTYCQRVSAFAFQP